MREIDVERILIANEQVEHQVDYSLRKIIKEIKRFLAQYPPIIQWAILSRHATLEVTDDSETGIREIKITLKPLSDGASHVREVFEGFDKTFGIKEIKDK